MRGADRENEYLNIKTGISMHHDEENSCKSKNSPKYAVPLINVLNLRLRQVGRLVKVDARHVALVQVAREAVAKAQRQHRRLVLEERVDERRRQTEQREREHRADKLLPLALHEVPGDLAGRLGDANRCGANIETRKLCTEITSSPNKGGRADKAR